MIWEVANQYPTHVAVLPVSLILHMVNLRKASCLHLFNQKRSSPGAHPLGPHTPFATCNVLPAMGKKMGPRAFQQPCTGAGFAWPTSPPACPDVATGERLYTCGFLQASSELTKQRVLFHLPSTPSKSPTSQPCQHTACRSDEGHPSTFHNSTDH